VIASTPKQQTTYPVTIQNDLVGKRWTIQVPHTRGEILEGMLPILFNPDENPTSTRTCLHVRESGLTVHVYNPDSLAEEIFGEAKATFDRLFYFFYGDDSDGDVPAGGWK